MNKEIKYIIYFLIGIISYYLLFKDNRLVEDKLIEGHEEYEESKINTVEEVREFEARIHPRKPCIEPEDYADYKANFIEACSDDLVATNDQNAVIPTQCSP